MADPGDKDYHRRNVIVDRDLVLKALDYHGGQGSMLYSFGSTGLEDYVSPSMIDAAVGELEQFAAQIKANKDFSKAEREELDELIGELDGVARFSSEFESDEGDSGYATWLMEEDEVEDNPSAEDKERRRQRKARADKAKSKRRKKRGGRSRSKNPGTVLLSVGDLVRELQF